MHKLTDTPVGQRDTLAEVYRDALTNRLAGVVTRLRRMADDVERQQLAILDGSSTRNLASLTADVLHTLTWGLANTNADQLPQLGHTAELYRLLAAGAFDPPAVEAPAAPKTLEG